MIKKIPFTVSLLLAISIFSCKQNEKEALDSIENTAGIDISQYESFGEEFSVEDPLSTENMRGKYENMKVGDSLEVSFITKVNEVCQAKGCWMRLDLGKDSPGSFVKFKDYEFFVPMDAADADAIIKGVAFKAETSVSELQHYAEDAGKSEEEIAAITQPKVEYTFMAGGVFLKK